MAAEGEERSRKSSVSSSVTVGVGLVDDMSVGCGLMNTGMFYVGRGYCGGLQGSVVVCCSVESGLVCEC